MQLPTKDEAHPKGAGAVALASEGSAGLALVPQKPHAVDGPPKKMSLQEELQMLQERDKENKERNQREKDPGGQKRQAVTKEKAPQKRPKVAPKPKGRPPGRPRAQSRGGP